MSLATPPAQSLRIGEALASFKESGSVVAYADYFSQYQYHIASYSDALYMHPGHNVVYRLWGQQFFS